MSSVVVVDPIVPIFNTQRWRRAWAQRFQSLGEPPRAELKARIAELELANFRLHQRAEHAEEELRASHARERFLAAKLRAMRNGSTASGVDAPDPISQPPATPAKDAL